MDVVGVMSSCSSAFPLHSHRVVQTAILPSPPKKILVRIRTVRRKVRNLRLLERHRQRERAGLVIAPALLQTNLRLPRPVVSNQVLRIDRLRLNLRPRRPCPCGLPSPATTSVRPSPRSRTWSPPGPRSAAAAARSCSTDCCSTSCPRPGSPSRSSRSACTFPAFALEQAADSGSAVREKFSSLVCPSFALGNGIELNGVLMSEFTERSRHTPSNAKNATGVIVTPL